MVAAAEVLRVRDEVWIGGVLVVLVLVLVASQDRVLTLGGSLVALLDPFGRPFFGCPDFPLAPLPLDVSFSFSTANLVCCDDTISVCLHTVQIAIVK